jgi:general secretion pathway protein B
MSYILEALKKAERERQQGRPPTVTTLQQPPAGPRSHRWIWLLAAILAVNALLLGWMLHSRTGPAPAPPSGVATPAPVRQTAPQAPAPAAVVASPAAEPAPQAPQTVGPAPAPLPIATVPTPSPPAKPSRPAPQTVAHTPAPLPAASAPAEPLLARQTPARAFRPATHPPVESRGPESSPSHPVQAPIRAAVPKLAPNVEPRKPQAAAAGQSEREVSVPPEPSAPLRTAPLPAHTVARPASPEPSAAPLLTVPLMAQLPAKLRNSLPDLRLDALLYSEHPPERMVFIDGRRYREGDTISGGPRVEEIRRDGAVLSYDNQRFMVPVRGG